MDIIKNFRRNKTAFIGSILRRISWMIPDDALYLRMLYLSEMHKLLHLKKPVTFNEKLQWLKLHNRKAEYTTMVDKYAVKEYVANLIGSEYIIPTLGVWDTFDEIDFDLLPERFVLKTTHGGGGMAVVICRDKKTFDKDKARRILEKSLKNDIYEQFREWPYKNVPRRIIAEKFLVSQTVNAPKDLSDYKFFCFNGTVRLFKVDYDRFTNHHANYYSREGKLLPFGEVSFKPTGKKISLPANLNKMIELAETLAMDKIFVRVDFYDIDNMIYFGELTFYPASGLGKYTDDKWDVKLGNWLQLPL